MKNLLAPLAKSHSNLPENLNSFIPSLCYKVVSPTKNPKKFRSLVWRSTFELQYEKDKFTFPLQGTGIFCYEKFPNHLEISDDFPIFLCQGFDEIKFSENGDLSLFKRPPKDLSTFSDLELQEYWKIFTQGAKPQNVKLFSAIRPLKLME